MGPVEVKILLSLGGWLFHGQSCLISNFYIQRQIRTNKFIKLENHTPEKPDIEYSRLIFFDMKTDM